MKPYFRVWVSGLSVLAVALRAGAQVEVPPPADAPPVVAAAAGLTPVQLLALARRPFLEEEWCKFQGEIRFRGREAKSSLPLILAMRLGPARLEGELVLDGSHVTRITQAYRDDGSLPDVKLQTPPAGGDASLHDMGVEPEDLTFCFLYWNFVQELAPAAVRGQDCRVLELVHPKKFEKVRLWMQTEFGFPLRVQWFLPGEVLYNRQLEFTDFKRYGDFWYPTGIRMTGPEWKTQINFTSAEVARPAEKPEPADLFHAAAPAATVAPISGGRKP